MIYDMKNKIILYSLLMLVFFACTPKSFKVNVEMANANGKTAYLQKIINNGMYCMKMMEQVTYTKKDFS